MVWSDEIVSDVDLEKAKKDRVSAYIFRNEVEEARQRYIDDGWEFVKEMKNRRVRLKKEKPFDEQFENRVWMTLYKLGFTEMNKSRKFTIPYKENGKESSKQIDVFAADDEIILLVECKSATKPGTKTNFKEAIESIGGYRKGVFNTLKNRYPNHKMLCVFATENYEVGSADLGHLKNQGIQYFNENTIQYYDSLGKQLGKSAKYQLLGNLFAGKDIDGMDTTTAAIKSKMGGMTYFSFTVEPYKLLKIAYILHRNSAQPEEVLPTYQRLIKKKRLNEIQKFVDDGGFFPNSIIINIDENTPNFKLANKENQPLNSESRIGLLELPHKYRSAYIIDGQHRLYGYADSKYEAKDSIPVVAFYNMDKTQQIKMFMDINEKQKAVPQTLRTTLNSDLLWDSKDVSEKQKALRSRIAQDLGELKKSPLHDRIIVGENEKSPTRQITLPFIDSAIDKADFLGKYKNNVMIEDGLFEYNNIQKSYDKLMSYFIGCLSFIKDENQDEWELSANEGAIFTVNVGISGLLMLLADILKFLRESYGFDIRNADIESLIEESKIYLKAVVNYVSGLDSEKRKDIKKTYGGNGPKNCLMRYREAVFNQFPDFCPDGLQEWIRDNNMQYNEETRNMLQYIEERIASDFKSILKKEYGDDWLITALDKPIYSALSKRASDKCYETKQSVEPWDVVCLEECKKIAVWSANWTRIFKKYFENLIADGKPHNKKDSTQWMEKCDEIAKNLNSIKSYSVKMEEYKLVKSYYDKLKVLESID